MKFITMCLGALIFLAYPSSNAQTKSQQSTDAQSYFNGEQLLQHIKTLSSDEFEGRQTGTKGGIKAKQYIIEQFQDLDVSPLGDSFEQKFSFESRDKMYQAANVLGLIKGSEFPDSYIVISAHYDHLGISVKESQTDRIYNGADDDASGTSALFSFAEYFKNNPPKHSVILAAFDSEELGLRGSKYFVDHAIVPQEAIMVNLNMDMISRNTKNELYAVGTRYNETLKQLISNFKPSGKVKLLTGHDGKDGKQNWTGSSDHGSFHNKKIPFLYFGVEDHDDYHKATDHYENIHPEFYKATVGLIISVFREIDAIQIKK